MEKTPATSQIEPTPEGFVDAWDHYKSLDRLLLKKKEVLASYHAQKRYLLGASVVNPQSGELLKLVKQHIISSTVEIKSIKEELCIVFEKLTPEQQKGITTK